MQAGGGDRHDAADRQLRALGGAQREAAAEAVADDVDLGAVVALAQLLDRGGDERVPLRQQRLAEVERRGRPEAGQIDRRRGPALLGESLEQGPPGVGAVGVAVEEEKRRSVPLEIERSGLGSAEVHPAFLDG